MSAPILISGSRASAILGLSKYRSQVDVWLEIKESHDPGFCLRHGYVRELFEGNAATRWGSAFESAVLDLTGNVTDQQRVYKSGVMSCTIDGLLDGDLVEAKTTTAMTHRMEWGGPGTDKIPADYMIQVQHNMMLSDTERAIVPVLCFPERVDKWEESGIDPLAVCDKWAPVMAEMGFFHKYFIDRNPDLQGLMLEKYQKFWKRYIEGNEIPEPVMYSDIKALCPDPVGTIIADERISRLMAEYKSIGEEISASGALGKRREEIKVAVLDYMRTTGGITDDESADKWILRDEAGKKIASWGRTKAGSMIFR